MEDLRQLGRAVHEAQTQISLAKTTIKEVLGERPVDQDRLAEGREHLAHARAENRTYLSTLERAKREQTGKILADNLYSWHA